MQSLSSSVLQEVSHFALALDYLKDSEADAIERAGSDFHLKTGALGYQSVDAAQECAAAGKGYSVIVYIRRKLGRRLLESFLYCLNYLLEIWSNSLAYFRGKNLHFCTALILQSRI